MASSERKRVFRKARGAEEEKKLLESSIPGSTRRSTRWAFNIFKEWQMTRGNKDASLESCSFSFDCQKVQNLDTNIVNMTTGSLNFWLSRFIQEVVKANGERYPARTLYGIVCGLNRYLQEESDLPVSILDKNETR
jgi:hypothetical protein